MWTWDQSAGALRHNGQLVDHGYSGADDGKNNPAMEAVHGVGPIPAGRWKIGAPYDTEQHGPHVLPLTPVGHHAHGRSEFLIHGDSIAHPGHASRGCIILGPNTRHKIWNSGDHDLTVVP